MSNQRLFLPDGRIHTVATQLPEDQPYRLSHDRTTNETVLLVRQLVAPGRMTVVSRTFTGATALFEAAVDFERSSTQLGNLTASMQNILVNEYGVPEAELEQLMDAALGDVYSDAPDPSDLVELRGEAPVTETAVGLGRRANTDTSSRMALLNKLCRSLRNDLSETERRTLAVTVAHTLLSGPDEHSVAGPAEEHAYAGA
ncbi:hypothetical protein GCM10023205_04970 [Yinghuangia aomiensis]|uniref:Uncharacterized protein n=1 Tax=Yinghuangia aomiensis TaxID=676205 RepID=A0ABP9GU83_9ACTN